MAAGLGNSYGERSEDSPKRKVDRSSYTVNATPPFAGQGWPATAEEWESRGHPTSPVRIDDVSLGEHQGWHYIKHRPGDRGPARYASGPYD